LIISHEYRYIFIKTAKTAGTSIEMALSRYCGPDDIITPLWKKDEEKRQAMGGRGPQHHMAPLHAYGPKALYKLLLRARRNRGTRITLQPRRSENESERIYGTTITSFVSNEIHGIDSCLSAIGDSAQVIARPLLNS
jgi:hypothetical protein